MGEETATSAHPLRTYHGARARIAAPLAVVALGVGLSACGDKQSQDANEPSGNFPVDVVSAKFPTDQSLAKTTDLRLELKNSGDEQIPDLAVTIYTGDEKASGPFSIRSDQPGLADPNRPVWILENGYPKCISAAEAKVPPCVLPTSPEAKDLGSAGTAGADVAQTDTFAFGTLDPGDSVEAVWQVTPVVAKTWTVHYQVAAGLNGKAKAVTGEGSPVEGEFVVTITGKVPRATVNAQGKVVIQDR